MHPTYCAAQIKQNLRSGSNAPILFEWMAQPSRRKALHTKVSKKKEQLGQSPSSPNTCIHSGDLLLSRSLRSSETPVTAGEIDQCCFSKLMTKLPLRATLGA